MRALQRKQRQIWQGDNFAAIPNTRLYVCNVGHFARTIDDYKNIVAAVHKHQVVQDAALVIQKKSVALFAHWQANDIDGHQTLEGSRSIRTHQSQLPHMRDVKQARRVARVFVFCHQPQGILHWHAVARKGNHARP